MKRIALHSVATVLLVVLFGYCVIATKPREGEYRDLAAPQRHLQQGLDYLDVDPNIPFDEEGAAEHFQNVIDHPSSSVFEREAASFLKAWCYWARGVPDFDSARRLFGDFLGSYPDSAFACESLFLLALIDIYDPFDARPAEAIKYLKRLKEQCPDSALSEYAAINIAELYRREIQSPLDAAEWYGTAFDTCLSTYNHDERLGFLYRQGKMFQAAGLQERAVETYYRLLDAGSDVAHWVDRVLDRLDELNVPPPKEYFTGLDLDPLPETEHRYVAEEPVTISVSFAVLDKIGLAEAIRTICADYEKRSEGVKIQVLDLPYAGYDDWVRTKIISKDIPDIVQMYTAQAHRYGAYQGKLLDTSQYLSRVNPYTGTVWSDTYYPQYLSVRDPLFQKVWTIPWTTENHGFYYNKDAFRQAGIVKRAPGGEVLVDEEGKPVVDEPETWEELIDAFKKLRDIGMYGEVAAFFPGPLAIMVQSPLITKQIYDNLIPKLDVLDPDDTPDVFEIAKCLLDGTIDLRDPEIAERWRLLYEKSEYWVPGSTSMDTREAFTDFAQGKGATFFWVSTHMPDLEAMSDFEIGVFPFPLLTDNPYYDGEYSHGNQMSTFDFTIPAVVRERKKEDAVIDFLMYLTSPTPQKLLTEKSVSFSPIRGVKPSKKMEPFIARLNTRGTHLLYFDLYQLWILKEPYWANAYQKLLAELNTLFGSIPNYEYYQRQVGGTPQEYQTWREQRFQEMMASLQTFIRGSYENVIHEYPEDRKRELVRANNLWISEFRKRLVALASSTRTPPEVEGKLDDLWRNVSDHLRTIRTCEQMQDPQIRLARYQPPSLSNRQEKQIGYLMQLSLLIVLLAAALFFIWGGLLFRIARDIRYIGMILPTIILLGIFNYFPAGSAIYHAFFRWNGSEIAEFVGLLHFRSILTDGTLHKSVIIAGAFLAANLLKLIPNVFIAVVLFHLASRRLQYCFRVVFVLPLAIPGMVGILIWKYFYRMDGGLLNSILLDLGVVDVPINWLGNEDTVLPALLFLGFPYISTIGVLILLAGLENIPNSTFEAARLDGCGVWRRFWEIEMPLIMGQIKLNIVLVTIGTIQDFALPLILTKGGPNNRSMLPGLWMYLNAFEFGKMGYAAALGVGIFLVILFLTYVNMRYIQVERD